MVLGNELHRIQSSKQEHSDAQYQTGSKDARLFNLETISYDG